VPEHLDAVVGQRAHLLLERPGAREHEPAGRAAERAHEHVDALLLREAADEYLAAYVALAARLKAKWVIVHGGYHFTSDVSLRKEAAIRRLARTLY